MNNSSTKIYRKLDLSRLPKHLAIIMDGNGRWATKRGLPRNLGHKAGCENIKRITQNIYDLGIEMVTFFAFSTENWKRPKDEIDGIFNLIRDYMDEYKDEYLEKDVKVMFFGELKDLPQDLTKAMEDIMEKTKNCKKMTVNFAVNYGGRSEILRAVNKAIKGGKELDFNGFEELLYTRNLPDPDFVIRTSGEMRISNFMLYQMAYSELYFTKTYWPSFNNKDLQHALINFQKRKRRFGNIK